MLTDKYKQPVICEKQPCDLWDQCSTDSEEREETVFHFQIEPSLTA